VADPRLDAQPGLRWVERPEPTGDVWICVYRRHRSDVLGPPSAQHKTLGRDLGKWKTIESLYPARIRSVATKAVREAKPMWSAVPRAVRDRVDEILGARVVRARRAFGGYGPSATFALTLADDRRAFFKGVYPLPEGSAVRWSLDEEETVYAELGELIAPWAPDYYGSLRIDGWHALVMEAVAGGRVPPWTESQARRAARSYADFHEHTLGKHLPGWLPTDSHRAFAAYWAAIEADDATMTRVGALAGGREGEATAWLRSNLPALIRTERLLAEAPGPGALLHFDTRSDNIRIDGELLRIFDWPFACVGPAEFDVAAFVQSIDGEGGPSCESVVGWYEEVLPLRHDVLCGSVAGIAGYFADRGSRPELPGLPRLRSVQRRQLKTSLAWAARLLDLDDPDWLDTLVA
jgi:hypothetical protein